MPEGCPQGTVKVGVEYRALVLGQHAEFVRVGTMEEPVAHASDPGGAGPELLVDVVASAQAKL